ncbi:MAG: recombinase family protein [Thermodesulfobacteriota bacterium]
MIAAIYTRVSTLDQVERDSLSTQESRLRAYCEANGHTIHGLYRDEGYSAKDTNRPAIKRLFSDIKAGRIQLVLVTKLDRITRSLPDLLKLVDFFSEHSVKFVSITQNVDSSGPFGRFMRDLLGLIAQLERQVTAERVSEDMRHRALQGKWNGGVIPYGYTTRPRAVRELTESGMDEHQALAESASLCPEPKKLYIDEKEAAVVRDIFRTYSETRSLRKTTHLLNSAGIRTRNGLPWSATSVRRILTNPTYLGKVWYGKRKSNPENGKLTPVAEKDWQVSAGLHDPIVSEEVFGAAQAVLDTNVNKPTRAKNTYLLSGLIWCGKCGGRMHGYTFTKKGTDATYIYYKCHNNASKGRSVCEGLTVQARPLEDFVVKTLMDLSKDRHFLNDREEMLTTLREEAGKAASGRSDELARLEAEERQIQAKLDTLLEKLESGLIADDDFTRRYEPLKARLAENRAGQAKAESVASAPDAALAALSASFDEVASFGKNWDFLDDGGKRMKLQTVVKEIKVLKDTIDMKVFLDVEEAGRMVRDSWQPQA